MDIDLSTPSAIKAGKKFVKEYRAKRKKEKEFFESRKFFALIKKINKAIILYESIYDDLILYRPELFDFSYKDFQLFCNSINANVAPIKIDGEFPLYVFVYQDLEISLMIGQGASWAITKRDEKTEKLISNAVII